MHCLPSKKLSEKSSVRGGRESLRTIRLTPDARRHCAILVEMSVLLTIRFFERREDFRAAITAKKTPHPLTAKPERGDKKCLSVLICAHQCNLWSNLFAWVAGVPRCE